MSVVIETTIGDITVDLFTEERPISCLNFIKLCKIKYYNYNLFHTIERGFIAQTGDPTGVGNGGCSVWGELDGLEKRFFEAENLPKIYHASAGLLSLVSAGKNLIGSQFFFTLAPNLSSLDGIHCVIGEVVEGHETLRKINEAIVDENFRPYQDIRITHTVILDDPFPDPRNFVLPSRSPSPTPQRLQNGRIAADEDIDETDGKTVEELQEMLAEREAKARATILEIVGDLPDAEMAPPENVLFVCKLNPVTTDDDLEIIFSRFGKVKTCEVIRDRKTGDSLQYAFVEFEEQKACEAAYFKMDNVLIDDRRIHVDFSQSVAKVKWRGKGRGVEGSLKNNEFDNLRETRKTYRKDENKRNENDREKYKQLRPTDRELAREERHSDQSKRDHEGSKNVYREYRSHNEREHFRKYRHDGRIEIERRRSRERYRPSPSHNEDYSRRNSAVNDRRGKHTQSRERAHNIRESTKHREHNDYKSSGRQQDMKRHKTDRSRTNESRTDLKRSRKVSSSTSDSDTSSSASTSDSSSETTSSDESSDSDENLKRRKRNTKREKKKGSKSKSHKKKKHNKK